MRIRRFLKILPLVLCDIASMFAAAFVAWGLLKYYTPIHMVVRRFLMYSPILAVTSVVALYFFGQYTVLWRYAGIKDIAADFAASLVITVTFYFGTWYWLPFKQPKLFYIIYFVAYGLIISTLRQLPRYKLLFTRSHLYVPNGTERILLIGGGEAANIILSEIESSPLYKNSRVVGIIDDDPVKHNRSIRGKRILGGRDAIGDVVNKYSVDTIIFAIPSCSEKDRREILSLCRQTKCRLKTLPQLTDLSDGINLSKIRNVEIEDLLGRKPIESDLREIMGYVTGRTVLVTGGGGSIGSELCRQLASYRPSRLVLFDIYENTTYETQLELQKHFPDLALDVRIGSITDREALEALFTEFRPDIVYHAAAHKHVPLMEDSPAEAIYNNVFGTLMLAETADKYGVKRFVMISTDKAVNPTNVMGTTKRMCEMIVQSFDRKSETEFVAVRFGNVLGSHGSVIPLFKKQLAEGGPLTVTHKDIIRYFMTIPEAASLVLQAGALARGGEIFVLDMGDPVRITELAENLIRLSGFEPYRDIDIVFTGLRPGEKLYEELLMDEEGLSSTQNKLIHVGHPIEFDDAEYFARLEQLRGELDKSPDELRTILQSIVPTYHPKSNQ